MVGQGTYDKDDYICYILKDGVVVLIPPLLRKHYLQQIQFLFPETGEEVNEYGNDWDPN